MSTQITVQLLKSTTKGAILMSKKQSLRIQISFKEKLDDLEIYNWVEENSKIIGVSAFIKSVLKKAMDQEKDK